MKPDETDRHARELTLLQSVSTILDQSIDMRTVVGPILEALVTHLAFQNATITLLRSSGEEILIEAAHGLSPEQVQATRYRLGEGVTGRVVLTGEPMVVQHTSHSSLFLNKTQYGKGTDLSFLCVPIKEKQEVIGALSVFRDVTDEETLDEESHVLAVVASMVARAALLRREVMEEQAELLEENRKLRAELTQRYRPGNIIGTSREMQLVYDQIAQVAKSQATVLIQGETGTGKELVAHAIHYASPRSEGPFVRVHCAALPESLIESELFGHVRGAFTGAISDRKGRFELADGGTIFLDEVGEIPLSIQAKLLRVLQEREFERVGGLKTIKVNVRILAATHRDLPTMVGKNTFREDLYYRLSVFPIYVPPLCKRKTDIHLLTNFFIERYAKECGKTMRGVSNDVLDILSTYRWPGNVRELENCIERAVLLAEAGVILREHLPPAMQAIEARPEPPPDPAAAPLAVPSGNLEEIVGAYERRILVEALKATAGNIAGAARNLSSTPRIIGYKVKQYAIDPDALG